MAAGRPTNRALIFLVAMSTVMFWLACGGNPSPPASQPSAENDPQHEHDHDHDHDHDDDHDDGGPESPAPSASATANFANAPIVNAPERSRARSTATYEEAMATAEPIDVNDDRHHLTDLQLTNPMRGVTVNCRVPGNARITIRTAVREGRAIGVTVNVRFERPKPVGRRPPRPPTRAELKAEAKLSAKIVKCVDGNVRDVVWPPNRRRDSFTMNF